MAEMEGELPKKRRLSLSLKGNRFKKVEETAVTEARKGFVPDNTAQSTKWAMGNFEAWKGSLQDEDAALYGGDILATDDPKLLCSCLCKYVLETRKENEWLCFQYFSEDITTTMELKSLYFIGLINSSLFIKF